MPLIESHQTPEMTLATLSSQKASLEAQLESQRLILDANNCTMSTPLVDSEGFPAAEVDIPSVLKARVRIRELRNDLEKCVGEVARALEDVYASRAVASSSSLSDEEQARNERGKAEERRPFARVDGVAPGSPAYTAGLQREDLIVSVASTSTVISIATEENPLARLVSLVGASENVRKLHSSLVRACMVDRS